MNKNRKIFIIMPIVLLLFCCALVPCFLLCKNSNGIISTNSAKNDNGKIDVKLCTYEDVSYEDNTLFVKSQLLIAADAEYSYSDIEKIISKYNGKIVGYIEFTNDYQIEFDKMDYDTLNKTAELLKTSLDKSNITLNLAYYQDNDTDKVPINKFEKKDKNGNWWRDAIKLTDLEKDNNSYQEVKIGIFDTLFDTENQDISYAIDSNNIWFNDKEKINKIASGMHGTDVTGFLAAKKNNKFGIDGVANNVKIYGYAYKGNIPDYNPVSIMDIKYWNAKMLAKGVKVINISSGNTKLLVAAQNGVARAKKALKEVSESLSTFYGKYIDAGYEFVVVKSAGNENGMQFIYCTESKDNPYGIKVYDSKTDGSLNNCKKIEGVLYDAQYDIWGAISDSKVKNRVIIVGSSSEENTRAYHSVTGKRVDIYAPGERLRSLSDDAPSYGTSFAAPMVSGTVSLMWGTNPNIEAEKIKYLLVTSATQPIKDENYQINSDNSDVIKMYKCLLDSKNSVDRAKTYKSKSATAKKANGIICGIVRIYEDGTILYNKEDCLVSIYKDNHEETLYKELTADKYGEFDTEIETGNYIIKAKTNDGSYESDAYKLKIDSGDSQYIDDLYMYRSKNQIIDNINFKSNKYLIEVDRVIYYVDKNGLWRNTGKSDSELLYKCEATNIASNGEVIYYSVYNHDRRDYCEELGQEMAWHQYDLYCYDLRTSLNKKILSFNECGEPICVYNNKVYYTDQPDEFKGYSVESVQKLYSYDLNEQKRELISDNVDIAMPYKTNIYYRNRVTTVDYSNAPIMSCDLTSGKVSQITDAGVSYFDIKDDTLFYEEQELQGDNIISPKMKFTVRKYDLLSGNTETLYSNVDDYIYLQYVDNNYIFYALDSKTDNYRLNLSNGEKTYVDSSRWSKNSVQSVYKIDDAALYYSNTYFYFYELKDGENKTEEYEKSYSNVSELLSITDDSIFAVYHGGDFYFYDIERFHFDRNVKE